MPKEIDIVLKYLNFETVIFLLAVIIVGKWLYDFFKGIFDGYKSRLKNFHISESAKEKAEEEMENRFKKIEDNQNKDYRRIKDLESHLYEIQEDNKKQNDVLADLNASVRDMRIDSMRSKILDAVPKCIDLTHSNIGSEDYTHLFQIYTIYEEILAENNMENSQCDLAMRMIRESYRRRLAAELLTDYRYLPPEEIKKKIRKADDAISWWTEESDLQDSL